MGANPTKRYDARQAARPAIARGTLAGAPSHMEAGQALALLDECAAAVERVTTLAPSRARDILDSGDRLARTWATESSNIGLNPPRAAVVTGAPQAVWCPVNPESCAAAGAVSRASLARPHGPGADRVASAQRRADSALARLLGGREVGKRTRRGKRAGAKHKR